MSDKEEKIQAERDACNNAISKAKPFAAPLGAVAGAVLGGPVGAQTGAGIAEALIETARLAKHGQIAMKYSDNTQLREIGQFLDKEPGIDVLSAASLHVMRLFVDEADRKAVDRLLEEHLSDPANLIPGVNFARMIFSSLK